MVFEVSDREKSNWRRGLEKGKTNKRCQAATASREGCIGALGGLVGLKPSTGGEGVTHALSYLLNSISFRLFVQVTRVENKASESSSLVKCSGQLLNRHIVQSNVQARCLTHKNT